MQTQRQQREQSTNRKLVRVLMGERVPGESQGRAVLALLKDYRADIRFPLLEENARLRAEIERLKTGQSAAMSGGISISHGGSTE